jgi:hypothetical protein
MELSEILDAILDSANNYRSLARVLDQTKTFELWEQSTDEQKEILVQAIQSQDRVTVQTWVRHHPKRDNTQLTVKELYAKARELGVINYSRKSTIELIQDINDAENRTK